MSWSFAKRVPRNDAPLAFKDAVRSQAAYNETAGPLLDLIAEFGIAAAKLAGENLEVTLSSSGHVGGGIGSCSVGFTFLPPAAPIAEGPAPERAPAPSNKKKSA